MADKKNPSDKSSKAAPKTRGLGRGLSALMADVSALSPDAPTQDTPASAAADKNTQTTDEKSRGINAIAIDQLVRNPDQPRKYFEPDALAELTQSIKDKGVLQPILVRPVSDPARHRSKGVSKSKPLFQIVAGERRWQAALQAGLDSMPALVRDLSDREVLEIGVVENVQRADLNPVEEALAYRALIDQFDRTQQEVSDAVGKSRSHVANMLRLLTLPERAQDALRTGAISTGHARAIVAAPDPDALVEQIIDKGLSVRDAEDWVRRLKKSSEKALPMPALETKSADIKSVEASLRDALGLIVDLRHKGPGGELRIRYRSGDQLEALLARLQKP